MELDTKSWLRLNEIIYMIYSEEDEKNMRMRLLEQLNSFIDFDAADFFVMDRHTGKLDYPVLYKCEEGHGSLYELIDYNKNAINFGKCVVYRETDIISEEKRSKQEYYQKMYKRFGYQYAIQMLLAKDKSTLGIITLYRKEGRDNFHYDDVFILDVLKEHIAYRVFQESKNAIKKESKLSISEAVEKFQLTKREHTILTFLMAGTENLQICEELEISLNTLKKHILNIYRKMNIKNRVQLFKMVMEYDE